MVMNDEVHEVPYEYVGPRNGHGNGMEYLKETIDVSDIDTIRVNKDHNVLWITEHDD